MSLPKTLKVSVYRYNPEQDKAPAMQTFDVTIDGKDMMVLDVLALIKEQDEGFAYRRSCREGVCGSDGMNMAGKNGLACITPLSSVVKGDALVIRPLPGLPIIRDLVVDMSIFYQQYEKVQPFLQNNTPRLVLSAYRHLSNVKSSMVCMSASYVRAVQRAVHRSGGTLISS